MPKQLNWQAALGDAHAKGQPHVLITVLAVAGSAPRQSGQKMVVTADGVHDTIGGGQLEQLAIERARSLLEPTIPHRHSRGSLQPIFSRSVNRPEDRGQSPE